MSDALLRRVLEEILVMKAEIRVIRSAFVTGEESNDVDKKIDSHRKDLQAWIDNTFAEKKAEIVLPARCEQQDPEICGRQSPDAVMERPGWPRMCRGCGVDPDKE